MSQQLTYEPLEPAGVLEVTDLRLYPTDAREEPPVATVAGGTVNGDGSWTFTLPDDLADGTYYLKVAVAYTDGTAEDDSNDSVTLPLSAPALPGEGLVPWVSVATLQQNTALAAVSPTVLARAAQAATDLLWALSGRQFPGERAKSVRVLAPACSCDSRLPAVGGRTVDSEALRWAETFGSCGCARTVMLPDPDVQEILSVTLSGSVLAPTSYELEDGQRLVRLDGHSWPLGSDGNRDRLLVSYVHGTPPPAGAVRAALALATAWAKTEAGGKCGIPSRTTQITAEGVTVVFDDFDVFRKGGTGISEADLWLFSVNPQQLTRRSSVLSPDSVRVYRR